MIGNRVTTNHRGPRLCLGYRDRGRLRMASSGLGKHHRIANALKLDDVIVVRAARLCFQVSIPRATGPVFIGFMFMMKANL